MFNWFKKEKPEKKYELLVNVFRNVGRVQFNGHKVNVKQFTQDLNDDYAYVDRYHDHKWKAFEEACWSTAESLASTDTYGVYIISIATSTGFCGYADRWRVMVYVADTTGYKRMSEKDLRSDIEQAYVVQGLIDACLPPMSGPIRR